MARNLRIETLAEGVEQQDQLSFLFGEGCEFIQGYFFSKPVPVKKFNQYLLKGAKLPYKE
jgi:EAL domain-containing protein (putative c-di-GMP-specific phosphodiesterase class I)